MDSRQRLLRESVRKSIREGSLRSGLKYDQEAVLGGCDLTGLDLGFLNILTFFKGSQSKIRKEDMGTIEKIANAMETDVSFISPMFIESINGLFLPLAKFMGYMPIGSSTVCKMIVEASKEFTKIKNNLSGQVAAIKSSSEEEDRKSKLPMLMNGIYDRIQTVYTYSDRSKKQLFWIKKEDAKQINPKYSDFDVVFLHIFGINSLVTNRTKDPKEINDLNSFLTILDNYKSRMPASFRMSNLYEKVKNNLFLEEKLSSGGTDLQSKRKRFSRFSQSFAGVSLSDYFTTNKDCVLYMIESAKKIKRDIESLP